MKTIKLLMYLFVATIIVASCDCKKCEQEKVTLQTQVAKLTAEKDSCCIPSDPDQGSDSIPKSAAMAACTTMGPFATNAHTFSFSKSLQSFQVKNCATKVVCEIAVPAEPNWLCVTITGGNLTFSPTAPPTSGVDTKTITSTDLASPANINVVKNNFRYPNSSYPSESLKIIGTDVGRNINTSVAFPTGGYMVFGNAETSPIFINRNTAGTAYTFVQATTSGLSRQMHTTAQVLAQRLDNETCP